MRALPDVERRAIFQCEVASVDYSKATGILTDIVGFFEEFPSHAGWPSFDPNWVYLGPLPQVCRHGGHPGLCGKTPDGEWKTGPTGSYPPEICKHMAVKAFADFCARACVRIQASTPADGDKERAGPLVMQLAGPKAVVDDWLGKAPQLPSSARDYVVGSSITVGLKLGGGEAVIDLGQGIPKELIPTLNTMVSDSLTNAGLHLMWTSLQLNLNTIAEWHRDWGNIGPSVIGALGKFHGGEFQVEGHPEMDINGKLVMFDGTVKHRSLAFKGTRFSFVAFRHPGIFTCDNKVKGRLKALGFVVEDPECLLAPVRTRFNPKKAWDPSYLYIGRGHEPSGLERSIWANPHTIKEAGSRSRAVAMFKDYIIADKGLLAKIPELEGHKLMCHCEPDEECHADVLIDLFVSYDKERRALGAGIPPEDDEVLAEADRRRREAGRVTPKSFEGRLCPTRPAGEGPPSTSSKGTSRDCCLKGVAYAPRGCGPQSGGLNQRGICLG